ncbi:MAG: hypothetical protein HOE90_01865 [Bacteriovoracaceae bacterium]|nr:hypothetical protein [Bacteriovoracaceae bacterium]
MLEKIESLIEEFNKETHGSTDYGKDRIYIMGSEKGLYSPLKFVDKKIPNLGGLDELGKIGFAYVAYNFLENSNFLSWYEKQFGKKLSSKEQGTIEILALCEDKVIFDSLETIHKCYDTLRDQLILINSKNLPVQVGEWYAKAIFGLRQVKSTSQRGFDFYQNNSRVEVKIHWSDVSSPKGVKLRKSLVSLADSVVVVYVAKNFLIRDICFLDSDFVLRKFSGKGHTIFLKDSEISGYFFSKSDKHFDKVLNKTALMRFASPNLAMKLDGRI